MTDQTEVMTPCCICFEEKTREELAPVEHEDGPCGCANQCVWDVCKDCMAQEAGGARCRI